MQPQFIAYLSCEETRKTGRTEVAIEMLKLSPIHLDIFLNLQLKLKSDVRLKGLDDLGHHIP